MTARNGTASARVPAPGNKFVIQDPQFAPDFGSICDIFIPRSRYNTPAGGQDNLDSRTGGRQQRSETVSHPGKRVQQNAESSYSAQYYCIIYYYVQL